MQQSIVHIALVVRDYDEAIDFYVGKLLLAKASKPEQQPFIGNQAGGRVFLFLNTDDFWRDYERLRGNGVTFVRDPKEEEYGTVAVFEDLYGNLWDLLQLRAGHPIAQRMAR